MPVGMPARRRPLSRRDRALLAIRETDYWRGATWVAIAMLAIIAVRLHEVAPFLAPLRPALLVSVGGLALVFQQSRGRAIQGLFRSPIYQLVLAYFGWACLTAPFALWIGQAVSTLQVFVPAIFLVTALLLCPPTLRTVTRLQAGLVGASAIFAVALLAMGRTSMDQRMSISGSLDSNDIAAVMALSFPLAAGLVLHSTGWRRWLGLVAAALLTVATTATGSRGGTLALVAGALTFVFGLRGGRKLLMLFLLVVGGIGAWLAAPPAFRERMASFAAGEKDYNYTAYGGRKQIWARARMYIIQNPLLGVGVGNFPTAEGETLAAMKLRGKWSNAHNAYLQAAAEMGLVGGALFVALLVVPARRAYRHWRPRARNRIGRMRHRPEFLAAIVAFAVSSIFLSHAYFFAFFGLIGIATLADRALSRVALGVTGPAVVAVPPPARRMPPSRAAAPVPAAPALPPPPLAEP